MGHFSIGEQAQLESSQQYVRSVLYWAFELRFMLIWLLADQTIQQALSNASVHDFLILDYNNEIGGRVKHSTFGKQPNGKPYTVELGANW